MTATTGREFFDKTRLTSGGVIGPSDQAKGVPVPEVEAPVAQGVTAIDLPRPDTLAMPEIDLAEAINRRQSVRQYTRQALSLEELSYLLWCTQGVKEVIAGRSTRRTVPSAGARHALETHLLINNVAALEAGLYRFLAVEHKLVPLAGTESSAEKLVAACLGQDFVATAAVTFIWVADAYRMTWRYGQRGYRYLLLDAGHVCQNLYLAAEAVGCGVCAIGAFDDDTVNAVLGLDGRNHFAVYLAAVGKKG